MTEHKLATLGAALLVAGTILASSVRGGARLAAGETAVSDAELRGWVDRRVEEWQPAADEKLFDSIGWTRSLLEAERLAAEHRRPIFWFTHDGKMNLGRC